MIASVLSPVQAGRSVAAKTGALPDASAAAGFAAMLASGDPAAPAPTLAAADDVPDAETDRQDAAAPGEPLPAMAPDPAADPTWLAAMLASIPAATAPNPAPTPVASTTTRSPIAIVTDVATPLPVAAAVAAPVEQAPAAAPATDDQPRPTLVQAAITAAPSPILPATQGEPSPGDPAPAQVASPDLPAADALKQMVARAPSSADDARPAIAAGRIVGAPSPRTLASAAAIGGSGRPFAAASAPDPTVVPIIMAAAAAADAPRPLATASRTDQPAIAEAAPTPADDRKPSPAPTPSRVAPAAIVVPRPAPPSVIATGAVAPAGELFAASIHAAASRPGDPAWAEDLPPSPASTLAGIPVLAAAATGGGADPSLDMRHNHWPGAMIDHIEKLRDAADAVDTRIRLVPDALGGIDVSLRRHDDGVQVTLRADQAATQALLADARPQLTALAEARGIRVVDGFAAGADGFAAGAGSDPSTAGGHRPPSTSRPSARAPAIATDDTDPADGRVA